MLIILWSAIFLLVLLGGGFLLDPNVALTARQWRTYLGRLILFTLLWYVAFALYTTRAAHPGLEWLLEALIVLVTCRLQGALPLPPVLLVFCLLLPLSRALVRTRAARARWCVALLWAAASLGLAFLFSRLPILVGCAFAAALAVSLLSPRFPRLENRIL